MADSLTSTSTPTPPRARRRWLRRIVTLVVVLVALVVAAPLALGIAPVRRFVAGKVSDALGRKVTIGGISAAWWSGLELRNVEVHNPEGYTGDPLLAIDRVKVDAAVWKAITGTLDAKVAVDRPVMTLIQGKDGHNNLEGLGGEKKERTEKSDGALPHLVLTVRDGRLAAYGAPGADATKPDVIDALTVDAETKPSGEKTLTLSAIARGAGTGGGDVNLKMDARLDAKDAGPVTVSVPPIDLARLARTAETAFGVQGLAGALRVDVSLVLDADAGGSGKAAVSLSDVKWRKGTGAVSMKALAFEASPSRVGDATRFDVALLVQSLRATGWSNRDEGLDEPRILIAGAVTRKRNGDLSFGDATTPVRIEGKAISGTLSGAVRDLQSDAASADVVAKLSVVLSPTLGRLAGALSSPDDDLRGSATFDLGVKGQGGRLDLHADGRIIDLTVRAAPDKTTFTDPAMTLGGGGAPMAYTEPSVTLGADGTWDGAAHTLVLSKVQLAAGAIRAAAKGPVTVTTSPKSTMSGTLELDADLSRLAGLSALVPTLSSVAGGTLHGEVVARQADDLTIDAAITGKDLAFTPGTLSSRGYLERNVTLSARIVRPSSGATTVEISKLQSGMATLASAKGPLRIRLDAQGPAIDGTATLTLNLEAVGLAFDKAIGLAPGQSISGFLDVGTSGASTSAGAEFDVKLVGRELMFPGSRAPGRLDGGVKIRTDAKASTTSLEAIALRGYGLDVAGVARLGSKAAGGPTELLSAKLDIKGDLEAARPLLAVGVADLSDATLSGMLTSHVEMTAATPGRRLDGKTTITRLQYGGAPDRKTGRVVTLSEPSVQLEHRIWIDAEPGLTRIEKATLVAEAASASIQGTSRTRGDDKDLSLEVSVDGDAARLAVDLRVMLGEGYEDMAGDGRIAGKFSVVGPTANDGRDLLVDGNLAFKKFSSAGMTVEDGKIVVARPAAGTPLTLGVNAKVNQGTLKIEGACELGKGESPWSARLTIRGLDTSPLVTSKGSSRYLALVLPAIVPANATTAVLSGLLDANLDVRSGAIRQPHLADLLTGPGDVHMTQGSVKESTLFQGLSGGGGGMSQLLKLVPGVGKEIESLSRALMFQDLSSRFTIGNRQIHLDPVTLISPSLNLTFKGVVGFDGATDLRIPLKLTGDAGQAIAPYLKDQTIPLKVTQRAGGSMKVSPDVKLESVGAGLIDDLFGKKKK